MMSTTEKIAALRDIAGMNQNRFAQVIGVAASTMTRLERGTPNKPSPDTLQKIADAFNEVSLEWLENDSDETLPAQLTLKNNRPIESLNEDHEGKRLRRFVGRYKPKINQELIGQAMGVSRNQVGAYYNTQRFRQNVRTNILSALSKLLDRPVSGEEVFGSGDSTTGVSIPTNLIAIPKITLANRQGLNARQLGEIQNNFMPALRPDSAMYAPKGAITAEQVKKAYAIEIGTSDRMEPLYFPGYWVLGVGLESSEYSKLYDGTVAILTSDGEFLVKKIIANNLRTTGVIELGSYTAERGGSVQLRKQDIQILFSISGIIYGLQ